MACKRRRWWFRHHSICLKDADTSDSICQRNWTSQVVTHPSTTQARRWLTSEIRGFSGATPKVSWTSTRPLHGRGGTKCSSILPISLQQIEYGKIHAMHSNELAKSYTMKPIIIYFDTYLGGDIVKLVVFSFLAYNTTYENVTKIAHFSQYFAHIYSKNRI